jgi:hypothetical protein
MSPHAPILPLLIPFAAALLQMACDRLAFQRAVGLLAAALLVVLTTWLTLLADDGQLRVYALGDWPAPFGIVLVVDRLAAAMTLLTACSLSPRCSTPAAASTSADSISTPCSSCSFLAARRLPDRRPVQSLRLFRSHAARLLHPAGARRRAGQDARRNHLRGAQSARLGALPDRSGLLYGTLGTLNLADLAYRLTLPGHDQALARLAFALLIVVFALKAGLLPLSFWLPHTYSAAGAPVAALFAIMTKVGIVAILRVQAVALAPAMPDLLDHWLTTLALATIVFAALGARWLRPACGRWRRGWCCSRPAPCCSRRHRQPADRRGSAVLPGALDTRRRRLSSCSPESSPNSAAGRRPLAGRATPQATWLKVAFPGPAGHDRCRAAAFLRFRRQADAADDAARSRRRNSNLVGDAGLGFPGDDRSGSRRLLPDLETPGGSRANASGRRRSPGNASRRRCCWSPPGRCWPFWHAR